MKALCWHGKHDVRVEKVPDPTILNPHDIIIGVSSTAICGSDLHLYNGVIPQMKEGDILGHEFMGEVVEVGGEVSKIKKGDRVIVPFTIACGECFFCKKKLTSACDNTNPNGHTAALMYGASGSGMFGYSHLFGGYAGGQAEYVRVPFGDFGAFKVPNHLEDEKVLFLTDIFPTGYMAAENCNIQIGDTVAVWGCGPVGMFAIKCAFLLGAHKVIAIDNVPHRLAKAAEEENVSTLNFDKVDVHKSLMAMTGGMGPDSCIDAVGLEAHGTDIDNVIDHAKMALRLGTDRPHVLRQAIQACRKGGTVSVPGVYAGFVDKLNFGAAFAKGLTLKMGQTHVHKYVPLLLGLIEEGKIDPSFVISHRLNLAEAAEGYREFNENKNKFTKVVMRP